MQQQSWNHHVSAKGTHTEDSQVLLVDARLQQERGTGQYNATGNGCKQSMIWHKMGIYSCYWDDILSELEQPARYSICSPPVCMLHAQSQAESSASCPADMLLPKGNGR